MRGAEHQHPRVGGDRSGIMPDKTHLGVGEIAQYRVRANHVQSGKTRVSNESELGHRYSPFRSGEGLAVLVW